MEQTPWKSLAAEDARANQQFVDAWKPKVETVTHARHKGMLKVILGEMLEHKRIFDQAASGREDLIGTHLSINPRTRRRRQHPLDGIASTGVPWTPVAIALGSNLGDRAAHSRLPSTELSRLLHQLRVSKLIDTAPGRGARRPAAFPERGGHGNDDVSSRARCWTRCWRSSGGADASGPTGSRLERSIWT